MKQPKSKAKTARRNPGRLPRLVRLLGIAASAQEDLAETYRGMNWTAAAICAEIEAHHLRKTANDFKTGKRAA